MAANLLEQGVELAQKGNYQEAIQLFSLAIADNKSSAPLYEHRGRAYLKLKQPELAIADFNQSLNLDSRQTSVYLERAAAFLVLGQDQSCIVDLQAALSLTPEEPKAYKLWAKVCLKTQDYDQAINYFGVAQLKYDKCYQLCNVLGANQRK